MICSISTSKSASNWLDRLRSSRGFPTGDHLDLDHFLTAGTSDSPRSTTATANAAANNNSSSNRNDNAPELTTSGHARCLGNAVTHVLCEVFYMGDANGISRKKSSRKQQNPKFCDVKTLKNGNGAGNDSSSDELRRETSENGLASSGGDNCDRVKREGNADSVFDVEEDEHGGEENVDLKEYSRSEVTVIDTSFEEWKVERLVLRRNNVWKVREMKMGWSNFVGKKRKGGSLVRKDRGDNSGGLSMEGNGEESVVPANEGRSRDDNEVEPPCKEMADLVGPAPINRPSKKLKTTASSVILVKTIPTNDPIGRKKLGKSSLKKAQKQLNAQKSQFSKNFQ
ncbi:hypothetical protein Ancab_008979 [Ancistrocladus abbreviatus]